MFEKFSNSWKLFKAAASVLAADRELLIFPIISTIGVIIISLTFAVPMFLSNFFDTLFSDKFGILGYVVLFLFYIVQYTVVFYANTALVGAAMIRLNGGDPTVKDGFRIANSRFGAIIGYALISATVGMILKALQRQKGLVRIVTLNPWHGLEPGNLPRCTDPGCRRNRSYCSHKTECQPASKDLGRTGHR